MRGFANKLVEYEDDEIDQIWMQMKEALVSITTKVCGYVKVESKKANSE